MLSPLPRQVRETKSLVTNPSTSAFPKFRVGRLLHYGFRGLFSVHSRYGLQTRQVALCDPLHRRLRRLCCLHRRSNCYRVERSSSRAGLSFPLWTSAFSRRTEISPLRSKPLNERYALITTVAPTFRADPVKTARLIASFRSSQCWTPIVR